MSGEKIKGEVFGVSVRARDDGYLNGADLVKACNAWRAKKGAGEVNISVWLKSKGNKEWANQLAGRVGKEVVEVSRGRSGGTWLHPLLFLDMLVAIAPNFKIDSVDWLAKLLLDNLIPSPCKRSLMVGQLYRNYHNKAEFPAHINAVEHKINEAHGVDDLASATYEQLMAINETYDAVTTIAKNTRNNDTAVRMALSQ